MYDLKINKLINKRSINNEYINRSLFKVFIEYLVVCLNKFKSIMEDFKGFLRLFLKKIKVFFRMSKDCNKLYC